MVIFENKKLKIHSPNSNELLISHHHIQDPDYKWKFIMSLDRDTIRDLVKAFQRWLKETEK